MAAYGHQELIEAGHGVSFATVTSNRHVRNLDAGIKRWRKNWPRLLRRIKREGGHTAYMQIPEQGKDGAYHVHILTTASISERWLKDNAVQCGFGYIADFEPVKHSGKAASYVSKYLTKHSHSLTWPKYFRRVNTSQNWPRPEPLPKNPHWDITIAGKNDTVKRIMSRLRGEKWHIDAFTT